MTCSNCTDADLGRICRHQSPEELLQLSNGEYVLRASAVKAGERQDAAALQEWLLHQRRQREKAQQRQVTLTLTAFDVDVLLDALDVADIEGQIHTDDYQRLTRLLREVRGDE